MRLKAVRDSSPTQAGSYVVSRKNCSCLLSVHPYSPLILHHIYPEQHKRSCASLHCEMVTIDLEHQLHQKARKHVHAEDLTHLDAG